MARPYLLQARAGGLAGQLPWPWPRKALAACDVEALRSVAALIKQLGRDALVVQCDVHDEAAVMSMVASVQSRFGAIDTLGNGAGVAPDSPGAEAAPCTWQSVFTTAVTGTLTVIQAVLPLMRARKRGNIINLVAPCSMTALPPITPRVATAWALVAVTAMLAPELRAHNINVSGLHPGGVASASYCAPSKESKS